MKLFFALCVLCASVVTCFALDRDAFTFTRDDLNVRIEPEQQRLAVRGKITLRNDSNSPQKNAALQISSSLAWRSIEWHGKALQFVAQPYESDIDHTGQLSEAIVTLPNEIPQNGTVELDIGYEGTIPLDTTRLTRIGTPKEVAVHTDWDQISKSFTAVRGAGYVAWYPLAMESASLSEGNSVFETIGRWRARERESLMDLDLCETHDSDLPLDLQIANGVVTGGGGYGGGATHGFSGKSQFAYCSHYEFHPLGLTVPMFVLANDSTLNGHAAFIHYVPDHKSEAQACEQAAENVEPLVTGWFGVLRKKVEIVELPDPSASPFESGTLLMTPLSDNDPKLAQMTLVHELTHAAFPSPRLWIYEGLAHFAQALYRERQDGRQAALDYMGLHREALLEAEKQVFVPSATSVASKLPTGQALITTFEEAFYRSKAAYVWWMLRDMVGEDALRKALAAYASEQDHDPAYMQHLIEAQAKRDLGWFFEDWVYNDHGLPDFRVQSVYPSKMPQGGYLVTITVENLGGAGAEVPVTLRFQGGDVTKRVNVHGKATAVIRIEPPSAPQEVVVNDGSVPETNASNNTFKVPELLKIEPMRIHRESRIESLNTEKAESSNH